AGAVSPRGVALAALAASEARPPGVSETSPRLLRLTSPSITESSHTDRRGQVLRHASITSARVRGRSATQARNCSMMRLTGSAMAGTYHEEIGKSDAQKKCPGPCGG